MSGQTDIQKWPHRTYTSLSKDHTPRHATPRDATPRDSTRHHKITKDNVHIVIWHNITCICGAIGVHVICTVYCIYCMECSATCSPAGDLNSSEFWERQTVLLGWHGWVDRDVLWWEPIMNHPQYYHKTTNGQTSSPNGSFILCSCFDHWYNPNSSHDSGPQLPTIFRAQEDTKQDWAEGKAGWQTPSRASFETGI